MEFGRLPSVDDIDFALPADPPENADVLRGPGERAVLAIGMPGWSDAGLIERLGGGRDATAALRAHAAAVPTNELNSTFYGYSVERFERWAAAAPRGFRFCPKLPREITHERGLTDADAEMERFVRATESLGDRRGATWFALPPYVGPDRMGDLAAFLSTWAPVLPLAVEVREPRWFGLPLDDLVALLRDLDATFIVTDTAGRRDCAHMRLSTPRTFVRFIANGLHPSDFTRLDAWAARLADWADRGLERADVFVHQRDEAQTVELAEHLDRRLAERGRPVLGPWREGTRYAPPGRQSELF